MQTNTLAPKTARITSPRVGRGSTRGKTSGRGTKGQNARAGHRKRPVREVDQVLRECHHLAMDVLDERYRL